MNDTVKNPILVITYLEDFRLSLFTKYAIFAQIAIGNNYARVKVIIVLFIYYGPSHIISFVYSDLEVEEFGSVCICAIV